MTITLFVRLHLFNSFFTESGIYSTIHTAILQSTMTGPQLTSVSCRLHKDGFFNLDEEDVYIKTEDEFLCGWRKKGTHPIALVCEACYIAGTINFAECWQIEGIYNDVGGPVSSTYHDQARDLADDHAEDLLPIPGERREATIMGASPGRANGS